MRKLLFFSCLICFLSCQSPNNEVDVWRIHQIGESEGGAPIYVFTDSNKTIKFFQNGNVEIKNGDWCGIRDQEGSNFGTYESEKAEIYTKCSENLSTIKYSISDDEILYLDYPGIEMSRESYLKVK